MKHKLFYFKDPVHTTQETLFNSVPKTNQFMLHRAKVAVCSEINAVWAECAISECQTRCCIKQPVGFKMLNNT